MIVELSEISRKEFVEGRTYGTGFAFAKRTSLRKFKASQPISACKDFLNDEVYAETTGNTYSKYGQTSIKKDLFDEKHAYLLMSYLDRDSGKHPKYELDLELFSKNVNNTTSLVKSLERKLKLPTRSQIYKTDQEGIYLIKLPKFWVQNTHLISLYALLVRNSYVKYKSQNLTSYFNEIFFKYNASDMYYITTRLIKYLENEFVKDTYLHSLVVNSHPHDKGIIDYVNHSNFKLT